MQPELPLATAENSPCGSVDDLNLAILDDVVIAELVKLAGRQGQLHEFLSSPRTGPEGWKRVSQRGQLLSSLGLEPDSLALGINVVILANDHGACKFGPELEVDVVLGGLGSRAADDRGSD